MPTIRGLDPPSWTHSYVGTHGCPSRAQSLFERVEAQTANAGTSRIDRRILQGVSEKLDVSTRAHRLQQRERDRLQVRTVDRQNHAADEDRAFLDMDVLPGRTASCAPHGRVDAAHDSTGWCNFHLPWVTLLGHEQPITYCVGS